MSTPNNTWPAGVRSGCEPAPGWTLRDGKAEMLRAYASRLARFSFFLSQNVCSSGLGVRSGVHRHAFWLCESALWRGRTCAWWRFDECLVPLLGGAFVPCHKMAFGMLGYWNSSTAVLTIAWQEVPPPTLAQSIWTGEQMLLGPLAFACPCFFARDSDASQWWVPRPGPDRAGSDAWPQQSKDQREALCSGVGRQVQNLHPVVVNRRISFHPSH